MKRFFYQIFRKNAASVCSMIFPLLLARIFHICGEKAELHYLEGKHGKIVWGSTGKK